MRDAITRYEAAHQAMGTEFTLVAYGDDPQYLMAVGNEVFEEIDRLEGQIRQLKATITGLIVNDHLRNDAAVTGSSNSEITCMRYWPDAESRALNSGGKTARHSSSLSWTRRWTTICAVSHVS